MPGRNTEYSTTLFDNALSLPPSFWDAVKLNPGDANIISAHALKILSKELAGETSPFGHQLWIICGSEDVIDLVLSCTESAMGTHPIFIFSPHPFTHHDPHFLQPRMEHLVDALHRAIPYERVFSVFAPQLITTIFVSLWSELTQIPFYTEPYYAAKLSFCTKRSFVNRPMTIHPDLNYELRLAVEADIPEAAVLCHGFAQASEPFVLSEEEALEEAKLLVQNNQLWIHRIKRPGEVSEIASIVAVTRDSDPVSAISKVFSSPNWRRLGCAERLVRYVCKHLLVSRERVVLFVAHDNVAASKVYHRVGFAGLDKSSRRAEGVNSWLEIGFDRDTVELGHW